MAMLLLRQEDHVLVDILETWETCCGTNILFNIYSILQESLKYFNIAIDINTRVCQ